MIRRPSRRLRTVLLLLLMLICGKLQALAGVTGGLTGAVIDAATSAPAVGSRVTVTSPSQSATVTTDARGHFFFLTLQPDTYTVTASKSGYQPVTISGQLISADSVQRLILRLGKALETIARTTTIASGSLVRPGTTADVYSIGGAAQRTTEAMGGGGLINQAYSAISAVPGAYVIPNQTGYYATISIRGGDFDQVGYEFDGVPVNRSFDNYPSSSASSLGDAEVQVYTGANPANSEGQGLSGFINQVIKTGTAPGYATGSLGIGAPAFYHRAAVEIGGATPDRLFSYYVGVAGSNQAYDYVNGNNGSEYDSWLGPPLGLVGGPYGMPYAPGWSIYFGGTGDTYFPLGPAGSYNNGISSIGFATIYARNIVANVHVALPHRHGAGRDDVQLLYADEALKSQFFNAGDDVASPFCTGHAAVSGSACMNLINGETASLLTGGAIRYGTSLPVTYLNAYSWACPRAVGSVLEAAALNALAGCVRPYGFPNGAGVGSPTNPNAIPSAARDNSYNDTAILKAQYTKNFGPTAFLRAYAYTFYSDWFLNGPYSTSFCNFSCPLSPDYDRIKYAHARRQRRVPGSDRRAKSS